VNGPGSGNAYFDKGSRAVVGKGFAVLHSGRVRVGGIVAWTAWAAVHLEFLAQASLRVSVFVQWVWMYLAGQRDSRLIVNHHVSRSCGKPGAPDATSEPVMATSRAVGGGPR
jgi:hypothetical protein